MSKYNYIAFLVLGIIILFSSCKKEDEIITDNKIAPHGYIQKGPYNNGTSIYIYELNNDLSPTGRTYNTQIENTYGMFSFNSIILNTNKIKIEASGYYFNEVLGKLSDAPLTLYALSDISNNNGINVNLVTSLEKSRIEYLMSNSISFPNAKNQAQKEIFEIFNIDNSTFQESELLNIMNTGEENAALLAISSIIQGYRNTASLSKLIADMNTDFKTDGKIDNTDIQTSLISDIKIANLQKIRDNLENYYSELELNSSVVPNFEHYIQQFIDSTSFAFVNPVVFPDNGNYGKNLLSPNTLTCIPIQPGGDATAVPDYSISISIPYGISVKVTTTHVALLEGINYTTDYSSPSYLTTINNINDDTNLDIWAKVSLGNTDTDLEKVTLNIYFNDSDTPFIIKDVFFE